MGAGLPSGGRADSTIIQGMLVFIFLELDFYWAFAANLDSIKHGSAPSIKVYKVMLNNITKITPIK